MDAGKEGRPPMALVTYVLSDCPDCGAQRSFGNVDVHGSYVHRGCKRCRHHERVDLPAIRKKVLYLDQFFFSHAFRAGDNRFVAAVERIKRLAALQILVAPFSSIHEDETHQWERRDDLFKFIKATARGHEFEPAYEVEENQILKGLQAWLKGDSEMFQLESDDAFERELHEWDSYMRIDVGRYIGDVDLIRTLKRKSVTGLVDLFDGWRKLHSSFDDDLQAEYAAAGKGYMDAYLEFALRVARGDFMAMLDAPIMSTVVQSMLHAVPEDEPAEERLRRCAGFLVSGHFKELPYQWLQARIHATLKGLVKDGAYMNRERALQRLSGYFFDVKHIATYAPYVDAFVMDQPMAELVSRPTVQLEARFGTKVFSLNNWDEFLAWLDSLEASLAEDHKRGLELAYPQRAV